MTDNAKHVEALRGIALDYTGPVGLWRDALSAAIAALERETPDVDARVEELGADLGELGRTVRLVIENHGGLLKRVLRLEAQAQPAAPDDAVARMLTLERYVDHLRTRTDRHEGEVGDVAEQIEELTERLKSIARRLSERLEALEARAQLAAPAPPAETPGGPSHIDVLVAALRPFCERDIPRYGASPEERQAYNDWWCDLSFDLIVKARAALAQVEGRGDA